MRGAAGGRGASGSLSYMRGHGTGARRVSPSDALGCDSRGVRALAYITICVADSTSRNQARRTGQTERNANEMRMAGGGVGISASSCKSMRAAGIMTSFPSP